jgi:signal peptidase I
MRNQTLMKDIGLNLLNEGKTIRIKAHGYSMYPCIKPGSVILIEPIHLKGIPVTGEIIALQRENGLIVHRLTRIAVKNGTRMYIARGDSNSSADNPVTIDKIAGRIVGAETSGENPVRADISINKKPKYISNRIRVIWIHIIMKIKRLG